MLCCFAEFKNGAQKVFAVVQHDLAHMLCRLLALLEEILAGGNRIRNLAGNFADIFRGLAQRTQCIRQIVPDRIAGFAEISDGVGQALVIFLKNGRQLSYRIVGVVYQCLQFGRSFLGSKKIRQGMA